MPDTFSMDVDGKGNITAFGNINITIPGLVDTNDKSSWEEGLALIREVKSALHKMQIPSPPVPTPPVPPILTNVAQANGDPWVPQQTLGLNGIDLTGVWSPYHSPGVPVLGIRAIIRQSGPYLNLLIINNGYVTLCAEGILNPINWFITLAGQANGETIKLNLQFYYPDWSLWGWQLIMREEKNFLKRLVVSPLNNSSPQQIYLRKIG